MYLKLLRNDLQQRFDVLKYEIIYTPPYFPKFQPIERVWGWSKNFVALLFYSGRKLEADLCSNGGRLVRWYFL
jgi:transposase